MALDRVSKIEVLCHTVRREQLLSELEAFGSAHLIDLSETELPSGCFEPTGDQTSDLSWRLSMADRVLDFLSSIAESPGMGSSRAPMVSRRDLTAMLDARDGPGSLVSRAWRISMQLAELDGERRETEHEIQFLEPWEPMDIPLERVVARRTFLVLAGRLERDSRPSEIREWIDSEPLVHMSSLTGDRFEEGDGAVVFFAHESVVDTALEQARSLGFVPQDFGHRRGTPAEQLEQAALKLDGIASKEEELREEACRIAVHRPELQAYRDALGLALTKARAVEESRSSHKAHVFHAWVRNRDLGQLSERLERLCETSVTEVEPDEGEVPPSPLTEKPVVEPYRMLTDMFGQPTRVDPDPTPIMAPFFALFFGICIGDAGYGLFLAAGALAGVFIVRRRGGNPRLFQLLFQGGLASILVGIFLGGWFGIDFDGLPALLQKPANLLNSLVPGYDPGVPDQEGFGISRQFLYVTLGLGLVQLVFGVMVNLVKRWRAGDRLGAVLDQSGWLLATVGLFPWLFNHYLLDGMLYDVSGPLDGAFLYILAAGAVLIFVMGGRSASGFGKIGLGAYAAYGIVNLLGDMLSYSRLFALALSSAIIAQVINQIGGMLAGIGIPVLGVVMAAAVIAGGHLFNLFMAVLSGYIHTARLQFVEFFSKFYDGTGLPFVPLKYDPVYVRIEPGDRTETAAVAAGSAAPGSDPG